LYLKQNFSKNPNFSNSSDIKIYNIDDINNMLQIQDNKDKIIGSPNYFEENFEPSSNIITFSFNPANYKNDNKFRFEFYDYINRFDRINA